MDYWLNISRGKAMGVFPKWLGYSLFIFSVIAVTGVVLAEQQGVPRMGDSEEMEQEAVLSGPQQTAWAETEAASMRRIATRIQTMLDEARQNHNILKITCLNDKLTQLNVTLRSFEERIEDHAESVRTNNAERRDHHYRIMVILAQRGRALRTEAEGCVGEDDVVFGRTSVTTTVDSSITEDETSSWPSDPAVIDRPGSASGYY